MGKVFRFKEFEVNQEGCAMKINTDGVILGAMASAKDGAIILDVGTGTGVIAMMLAQRFSRSCVDGVEIDTDAYQRANFNFKDAPFATRLKAYEGSFLTLDAIKKYDAIISNPPFYTNSLHNPDERKKLARHADLAFFQSLLHFAQHNVNDLGTLELILPTDLADEVVEEGKAYDFVLTKVIEIQSFADTEVIRKIITLTYKHQLVVQPEIINFIIYKAKGEYSDAYRTILKPFFLAF